jgi:hypothetical protein
VREATPGEAVKLFMRTVGVPAPFIGLMRVMPVWKKLTAVAHTLPYDLTLVAGQQPPADVDNDTLVILGGEEPGVDARSAGGAGGGAAEREARDAAQADAHDQVRPDGAGRQRALRVATRARRWTSVWTTGP